MNFRSTELPRLAATLAAALVLPAAPASAQIRNPCAVITKAEAEAVVGGPLIGPQPSPQGTLCKYYEAGYGESPGKIRLVTIGIWRDDQPDDEAVNTRRLAVLRDSTLLPLDVREMGAPGDAAIWVWAGNRLGALYAFRGGNTEVAVKISGTTQQAALAKARLWAIRALGGAGRTSFEYAARQLPMDYKDYFAPRLLSALYLGVFKQIPDDPMTRNYVLSLAQGLNSMCPSVPRPLELLQYGFYNEVKGQKDMFKDAFAGNAPRMFHDVVGMMKRVRPHMLEIGDADAQMFVVSQNIEADDPLDPDPATCLTPQLRHLYDNIAELVVERHNIAPDVADDQSFLAQLRPDGQRQFGFDPRAPRVVTGPLAMKQGCGKFTAGAAASGEATAMETFCRCLVDAAVVSGLPDAEMRALGAAFDDQALRRAGERFPAFAAERRGCYH